MVLLFQKTPGARDRAEILRELADWTRQILKAGDEVGVSALDIDCCDDSCCDPETVILVMREDRAAEAISIGKPLDSITYADVEAALSSHHDCDNTSPTGSNDRW